jgi:protein TonB
VVRADGYGVTTLAHSALFVRAPWRLAVAIVLSLALHVLAWHLLPPLRTQIAPLARSLHVLLVAEEPAPVVEPVPQPLPGRPAPAAPKPRPVERTPRPPAPPETAEVQREPVPPSQENAPRRAEPEPPILTRRPEPAQASVAIAPPAPDLLAGYGSSVSRLLARHREYPRIAAMRGWEGTVMMSLRVGATGRLLEAKVDSTSSHPVLDAQALEMVKRVAELPTPPEGLRGREFSVLVPVVFRLER